MNSEHCTSKIDFNEPLMRKVVYAISKAVTEDVPQERRENHLETNNRHRMAINDFINENLRKLVSDENISLLPLSCGGWDGRILIDNQKKVSYTIMRGKTLQSAITKKRSTPYYLQTLLVNENGDLQGHDKQLYLFDCEPMSFPEAQHETNCDRIMRGQIDKIEGCRHYIITYEAKNSEIQSIVLLFLDGEFSVIDSMNLMNLLTPDFATLTSSAYVKQKFTEDTVKKEPKESLLKVRPGVKPVLRAEENEA